MHNPTMRAVFRFFGITAPFWALYLPAAFLTLLGSVPAPPFMPSQLWFGFWAFFFVTAAICTGALLNNTLKLDALTITFPPLKALRVPIADVQQVSWFWHSYEKQIYLRFLLKSGDYVDIHRLRLSPYKLRVLNQFMRTWSPNCKFEAAPEDLEDVVRLRERLYKPEQISLKSTATQSAVEKIEIPYQPHEQFEKFKHSLLANEKYFWYCWLLMWALPCFLALPSFLWRRSMSASLPSYIDKPVPPLFDIFDRTNNFLSKFVWDISSNTFSIAYSWIKNPMVFCILLGVAVVAAVAWLIFFVQPNQIILRTKYLQIIYRWKIIGFYQRKLAWEDIVSFGLDQFGDAANPEKWRIQITMKDGLIQNLNIDSIKGLCARETLLKTISQMAPDAVIDPALIRALMPPQRESYTELWLQSLSAPPKRNRLTPLTDGQNLKSGKYKVLRQLASGGQGVAYIATDETNVVRSGDCESVVLKEFVLPVYTSRAVRKQALERFENEASILEKLDHPQIVKLKDFFLEDHRAYLVLEHIDGQSLRDLVHKSGPLTLAQITALAQQMCTVLDYLHTLSPPVVHRDFTPDNLILDSSGRLVLIDFNVAQQQQWTTTSTVVGKHAYLPAEQFRGKPVVQSDLYAMGATLFFLCTGKDPEPISCSHPQSVNAEVPVELDRLVAKLTADQVEERYQSALEVGVALDEFAETQNSCEDATDSNVLKLKLKPKEEMYG